MGIANLIWSQGITTSTVRPRQRIAKSQSDTRETLVIAIGHGLHLVEIDLDQAWYWTPAWQARAREAEEDLRLGRYTDFDNMDDFIASLDKPA